MLIRWNGTLFLLAMLGEFSPTVAAEQTVILGRHMAGDQSQTPSRCSEKCDELKRTCDEHERLRPTCSVVNICVEEKIQCEAQCRPRAMLNVRTGS